MDHFTDADQKFQGIQKKYCRKNFRMRGVQIFVSALWSDLVIDVNRDMVKIEISFHDL